MTISSLRGLGAALALSLAAASASAVAQPPAPPTGYGQPNHQRMQAMMEKRREAMSRDLHALLNIRPDQEGAFSAFQGSMMGPPHSERPKHGAEETMTTPQRLDQMLTRMDERMVRMRAKAQATKTFYAALSPEQQRAFDALERMHHHHGEGHGGGRWGGEGERWGGGPGGDGRRPPPPSGE